MHGVSPAFRHFIIFMTVAALILTAILTLTADSNSNMPKPAGVTDHLNLSDSVLASTETVQSDAGALHLTTRAITSIIQRDTSALYASDIFHALRK